MFVQGNQLSDLKSYFTKYLSDIFSLTELQLIVKLITCKRLNISEKELLLNRDIRFSESDLLYFRSVLKRLLNHEPFQYILGETEFYGLLLKTDHRALIPRPETEELVDWIVQDYGKNQDLIVLDACTGSGCIALALKKSLLNSTVHAVEFSGPALDLARENAELCNLTLQVHQFDVIDSEGFRKFAPDSFHVWVSNPPYIPENDRSEMAANVLDFEPGMALFVPDEDPLLFYRRLSMEALRYLVPGGALYFELHEHLGEELIRLMEEIGFVNIELRKDLQGKNRMLRAQKRNFTT